MVKGVNQGGNGELHNGGSDGGGYEQAVRRRIDALSYLPTTMVVAMKFIELGKDPDTAPAEYSKVIASDCSLASKLLSLANSSWFGVRHTVTKVPVAVSLLGLGTVRTLAISYCVTGLHHQLKLDPEESNALWAASLTKAVAARTFAALHDPKLAEEAFAAGLFQDFAVPVMVATAREPMLAVLQEAEGDWKSHLQKERGLFRLDHAELGRTIAQKLDLPDMFVDAVAFHHNHASLREFIDRPVLADAVYVASLFPHLLTGWARQDAEEMKSFVAAHAPTTAEAFIEAVQKEYDELCKYFEQGASQSKLADLLSEAFTEIADSTTRLVGTVQQLLNEVAGAGKMVQAMQVEQQRMEVKACLDSLTGALNRKAFGDQATECVARACRYRSAFALMYLDCDEFKAINDTLGHAAGDRALGMLVGAAQKHLRPGDLLGRIGGDEFALLLQDVSRETAVQTAQAILAEVAGQPFQARQTPPRTLTLSAGVLWVEPQQRAYELDQLLHLTDCLMYSAKRAGGNRVHWRAHDPAEAAAPAPNAPA